MHEIETDWWFIALPEQWHSEVDEDCILIFDEDELGCISLSTLLPEDGASVGEAGLRELLAELGMDPAQGQACDLGARWRGWEFETREEGDYIREWYLWAANHLLLVSYSCDEDDREFDRSAVDQILDSLRLKE